MKREEIKEGVLVMDKWYLEYGVGRIVSVKKTRFTVIFGYNKIRYDYPHAQFLMKYINENYKPQIIFKVKEND